MPFGTPILPEILFCSFHTQDDYYASSAETLRNSLDRLGIAHEIAEVSKAPGEEWLEICRKKIPFLHSVCQRNPHRKIFWIDVDCDIDYLPDFVADFSADIIGFQRGFGHPMRIGYSNASRFWEPCFWGINTTSAARNYIRDAYAACNNISLRATDDFFFEEAWRKNAERLTFQMIPSSALLGRANLSENERRPFFYFGSSGNVAAFKGQAAQHDRTSGSHNGSVSRPEMKGIALKAVRQVQTVLPQRLAVPLRRFSDEIGLTEYLSPSLPASPQLSPRSIYNIIHDAREGRHEAVDARIADITSRRLLGNADRVVIGAASALLDYATSPQDDALPLLWWDKPYPGNYGDWLSPLILQGVCDRPLRFQRHDEINADPHLMAVGSIGRFAQRSSILAGTGFSCVDTRIAPNAAYISLRGPYSAKLVADAGGPKIDRFGDPAVILPRLIPLKRQTTNGRLALVRHFAHRKISLRLPGNLDEHSVLVSRRTDIEALIGVLLQYDAVLTSAMHIYITCQAYGIPVALITFEGFEDAVSGDNIKYRDYAAGVGLPERIPQSIGHDLRHRALEDLVHEDRIPPHVMDEVETALADAVAIYDSTSDALRKNGR